MSVVGDIVAQAKQGQNDRLAFSEGQDPRIIQAAVRLHQEKIAQPILLGDPDTIRSVASECAVSIDGIQLIAPKSSKDLPEFTDKLYQLRQHKGVRRSQAEQMVLQPLVFSYMLLVTGQVDGCVNGAVHSTANVVKNALQIIGVHPNHDIVSSFFIMVLNDDHALAQKKYLFSDCALIVDPSAKELATIAQMSALNATLFLQEQPRVAMLSFSTQGSAQHPFATKVQEAVAILKARVPTLCVDGEIQFDAAIVPKIARDKMQNTQTAGRANVLVFPNLEAGNIGYKIAQRMGRATAIGPILQGLKKPANDLSRGCSIEDVFLVSAATVIQASNLAL